MLDDGGQGETAHPDMCITFNASDRELRIEFKVIACRGNENCGGGFIAVLCVVDPLSNRRISIAFHIRRSAGLIVML